MMDTERPEADLIEGTRRGDERAFELLMRRHSQAIRRLIARYFRNHMLVDDLAQETFVRAYFGLSRYRGDAPFVFWLKQIAVRLCLDEMRRRKAGSSLKQADTEVDKDVPAPADGGTRQIEARLLLEKMLAGLNPVDRMILILLDGEGYDAREISRLTGLSRANVKVRAFRIRRRLRALYGVGEA